VKVKKLAEKIKKLNIDSCTSCPFYKRDGCKLPEITCVCIDRTIALAKGLLQLEHFLKTGEVKEILEEEEND